MSLEFIGIVETGTDEEYPRGSSLLVEKDGSLRAVGNIPHGYTFKMKTPKDAGRLAAWLQTQGAAEADTISPLEAIGRIHALLDVEGEEWDSETIELVAEVVAAAGYTIRDPNEPNEPDPEEAERRVLTDAGGGPA